MTLCFIVGVFTNGEARNEYKKHTPRPPPLDCLNMHFIVPSLTVVAYFVRSAVERVLPAANPQTCIHKCIANNI